MRQTYGTCAIDLLPPNSNSARRGNRKGGNYAARASPLRYEYEQLFFLGLIYLSFFRSFVLSICLSSPSFSALIAMHHNPTRPKLVRHVRGDIHEREGSIVFSCLISSFCICLSVYVPFQEPCCFFLHVFSFCFTLRVYY